MSVVNVSALVETAIKYQKDFNTLPYAILGPQLAAIGIGLRQVANKDVITNMRRKGGLLRPYAVGQAIENQAEIMRFNQRTLKVEKAYMSMKDNILNYQDKKILNKPQAGSGINKTKEHPLKQLIVDNIIIPVGEDILDALFFAERDESDLSPMGVFDGYNTIIANDIASGDIAVGKKNLISTGDILSPNDPLSATDTAAVDQLVEFVRAANPFLRSKPSLFYLPHKIYLFAIDALENKLKHKPDATLKDLENYINEKAGSKVKIIVADVFGTGDRIELTRPYNFEFGMETFGDQEFVQVRKDIYPDPNEVNFWLQAMFGTRINDVHEKVFCINDGTPVANSMSGDYQ